MLKKRFYHSVRFKLLLVSLTLLGIPWAGYRFIIETEQFLRGAQQQHLQTTAEGLARLIAQQSRHFNGMRMPGQVNRQHNLFLNHWTNPPVVDGYADEWQAYEGSFSDYQLPGGAMRTRLAIGANGRYAYLLLKVMDSSHDYGLKGDRVDISLAKGQTLQRLRIQPRAPGWVIATRTTDDGREPEPSARGEWQETRGGYVLELRLPLALLDDRLSIAIHDSQSGDRLQTARLFPAHSLGRLVSPSEELQDLLEELAPLAMRAFILDHEGLVLARTGSLDDQGPLSADQEHLPWLVQQLILAVLPRKADAEFALEPTASRLRQAPVSQALDGRPSGLRRRVPGADAIVVSAAVPIRAETGVIGAVLIEQTTNAILSIQNLALQRLFAVTLVFFVVTSLGLLLFASVLTTRIRRLRDHLEDAVSHDGRIIGQMPGSGSPDEIGELERGIGSVLIRLGEYNSYLEAMASRLAHELRTPLSVVRTSLDNVLQSEVPVDAQRYIERAQQGSSRLELILKHLREATRLEQALQQAEPEHFDLAQMLRHQVEAFRGVWPKIAFQLSLAEETTMMRGVPDLICQALEKLVGNAVDFHQPETPIRIELCLEGRMADLSVVNLGPALPAGLDLFRSMVSGRTARAEQPHLGLGLYLVRLIAEFHHGEAYARDTTDQAGVRIGIRVPVI